MTANSSKGIAELHHLKSLAARSQRNTGSQYIVKLLDDFCHVGPNGCHQCLVFELLGPSISTVIQDYHKIGERLEPEIILKMSTQLLQAIAFLHRVGYAHGGMMGHNHFIRIFFLQTKQSCF
jgi:serine/threonine-protein kinase SRPK3